ncbi:MAG: hypothetical protein JRN11_07285 [Nitrososphaerota archaeon]|nr:hypothetical protein [Nitrososphaerota archaeon]MDG7026533.1 hypothetical protein [Nitrososphaerota archaeon]
MEVRSGLYQVSAGYVTVSRYFFLALAVVGLLGTVTGVFAQSSQVQLALSNVRCPATAAGRGGIVYSCHGTVTVASQLKEVALRGNITVVTDYRNHNYTGGDPLGFSPSSAVSGPGTAAVNASASFNDYVGSPRVTMYVQAYDPNSPSTVYATAQAAAPVSLPYAGGSSEANLFILTMEIPLFQVPALGISSSNPDFKALFATFDQLPLGDFYMLIAEVAIILLVGAGLIDVIMYLTGNSERQKGGTSGSLAGISNVFVTLLLVLLLPYAYNAVAGFVNVLDQQIIAGPGNPYTAYLANSQLIWNTLPSGGNLLTDFIGAIASVMAWAMSWLLGSARIFLIGSVTVAMPIVLVLRNIKFTARFAGVVEDTFFGLIFASVISALFIGLAAYMLNHWSGSIFQAASVDQTWVALAALLGAILAPTVFAPMTGFFFQTMSQVGMAAAGTAFAIGAGAAGPGGAGVKGGMAMAGQALGGLAINNPAAGFREKAGAALGGFGGGFSHSVPHMLQNMALMGTVGTLGGLGASRSASAINRAIDLKMPGQTAQNIVSYRAGALTTELQLPQDMKPHIERALAAKMDHNEIRRFDIQYHDDIPSFKSNLNGRVKDLMGRP